MWGRGGMADAADSKSADLKSCGFKSRRPHHLYSSYPLITQNENHYRAPFAIYVALMQICPKVFISGLKNHINFPIIRVIIYVSNLWKEVNQYGKH